MEPILATLLAASLAAGASALAAVPFALRDTVPARWIGWADAVAAGLMLGLAYALLLAGLEVREGAVAAAALAGVLFVALTHRWTGTPEQSDTGGYRILLASSVHAAHEGVAIGAAMAADWRFGVFTAAAIAVHNVPESAELVAALRARGAPTREAAGLAVAADANQVLCAVVTLALITRWPALQPWAAGFAVGALSHLVLVELLPASYRASGRTSIALVTIAAMGAVTFLGAVAP